METSWRSRADRMERSFIIDLSAPFYTGNELRLTIPNTIATPSVFKSESKLVFANKDFFKLLGYERLAGSPEKALNELYQTDLNFYQPLT